MSAFSKKCVSDALEEAVNEIKFSCDNTELDILLHANAETGASGVTLRANFSACIA